VAELSGVPANRNKKPSEGFDARSEGGEALLEELAQEAHAAATVAPFSVQSRARDAAGDHLIHLGTRSNPCAPLGLEKDMRDAGTFHRE
jgi:hypothetical protein